VLLGVVGLLAVSYAFPLRAWLDQRSELAAAESERTALQREVDGLTDAVAAWDDPAYVRAQARERLNFVLPGEVGLVVLGTEANPAEPVESTGAVVPEVAQDQPWWTGLVAAFYEVGNATPADTATAGDPAATPGQAGAETGADAATDAGNADAGTTPGETPALP
jgi:hypothetical protein